LQDLRADPGSAMEPLKIQFVYERIPTLEFQAVAECENNIAYGEVVSANEPNPSKGLVGQQIFQG